MSSGPSGASNSHDSNSHDNHPAVPESLGLMNVARGWSARGPGGLKDTDWYIELESLSETLTCKVLLIKDLEPLEQGKKRPREVGGTEEGMVPIAEELVVHNLIGADFLGMKEAFSELETAEQECIVEAEMADKTAVAPEI